MSAAATSHITALDWLMIALYFSALAGVAWWVVRKQKDSEADYFGRAQSGVVDHRRIYFCFQYRVRTHCWTRGSGRHQRRGHGALRIACLVPAGAGLGVRAVLHALNGFHHARVSGTAVQRQIALRALHRLH